MTDLTVPFSILREKYIAEKKNHLDLIFQFIDKSSITGRCVICMEHLATFDKQLNTTEACTIESKLCEVCILKTHSKTPAFSLKICTSHQFLEIQHFLDILCGLGNSREILYNKIQVIETSIEDLIGELEMVKECDEYINQTTNPFYGYIKNYKSMLRRANIKRLIKSQIRSKINVIEEQLETLERNHAEAVLSGQFEDSNAFKEVYYLLFQSKIKLEESLINKEY